ncbi:unannotated protein [freshwater metagenome]|uniref:Unannotated protein n=1 Tax=freshwater metagenome TaxID=449393 RepID=A0A6J6KNS3_9ZZZZ
MRVSPGTTMRVSRSRILTTDPSGMVSENSPSPPTIPRRPISCNTRLASSAESPVTSGIGPADTTTLRVLPAKTSVPALNATPSAFASRSMVPASTKSLNSSLLEPIMRLSASNSLVTSCRVFPVTAGTLTGLGPNDTMSLTTLPRSTDSPDGGFVPLTTPAGSTRSNSSRTTSETSSSAAVSVAVASSTLRPATSGIWTAPPTPPHHHAAAPPPTTTATTSRMTAVIVPARPRRCAVRMGCWGAMSTSSGGGATVGSNSSNTADRGSRTSVSCISRADIL